MKTYLHPAPARVAARNGTGGRQSTTRHPASQAVVQTLPAHSANAPYLTKEFCKNNSTDCNNFKFAADTKSMGGGGGAGGMSAAGAAGVLLSAELCAPLLLLCGLCCWPLDDRDDTSSTGKGKHPQKPAIVRVSSRRRSSEVFSHKAVSSAASLHLPSTSGHSKQSLAAHRSHEEIRSRRPSASPLGPGGAGSAEGVVPVGSAGAAGSEGRYHSAPSVIDEVLHRRDWERSSRELYIPLRPEADLSDTESPHAPRAQPESSSIECIHKEEKLPCKKHYTNIKSSRNRTTKERNQDDVKDTDATESEAHGSKFYIGDSDDTSNINKEDNFITDDATKIKSVYKAKDAKQSFNESIRTRESVPLSFDNSSLEGYYVRALDIDLDLYMDELDRSGAMHCEYYDAATPTSLTTVVSRTAVFPPPSSVEAVGWDGGACYLREGLPPPGRLPGAGARGVEGRGRHASDGDILAPAQRPESGAFSESDLELELEQAAERPPRYEDLQTSSTAVTAATAAVCRKETAI